MGTGRKGDATRTSKFGLTSVWSKRQILPAMRVILLTVFLSLVLVAIFAVLFIGERRQRGSRSPEQDALLPLTDDDPKDSAGRD